MVAFAGCTLLELNLFLRTIHLELRKVNLSQKRERSSKMVKCDVGQWLEDQRPKGWLSATLGSGLRTNAPKGRVDRNWTESGGNAP